MASAHHRFAMCQLAAEPLGYQVSDLEIRRESDSYTVFTLHQLKQQFPRDVFYLLMGEDMFLTLSQWKDPEEIFSLATLCVSPAVRIWKVCSDCIDMRNNWKVWEQTA